MLTKKIRRLRKRERERMREREREREDERDRERNITALNARGHLIFCVECGIRKSRYHLHATL